jgi:CheY-like chemotaxis protein
MPSLHSPKAEVLIVDDEVQTRELLSEFCQAQGYTVATAHDGRAALTAIARGPRQFSVVITDLQLPGADGFDVLRAAREANPSAYVVMITGYASLDSAVGAVRDGAYDYLAKPFALGQLEASCAELAIGWRSKRRTVSSRVRWARASRRRCRQISAGACRRSKSGSRISRRCCARAAASPRPTVGGATTSARKILVLTSNHAQRERGIPLARPGNRHLHRTLERRWKDVVGERNGKLITRGKREIDHTGGTEITGDSKRSFVAHPFVPVVPVAPV